MTRKHFQMIADVIKESSDLTDAQRADLASRMAGVLRSCNPRFDRDRFLRACGAGESYA